MLCCVHGLTGGWMVRLSLLMWWTMPEMQRGPAKPSRSARKRNVMLRMRGLPNAFLRACQIHFGLCGAMPWGLLRVIKRRARCRKILAWRQISHFLNILCQIQLICQGTITSVAFFYWKSKLQTVIRVFCWWRLRLWREVPFICVVELAAQQKAKRFEHKSWLT